MNIIYFIHPLFHFLSDLQFKSELLKKIKLKQTKSNSYSKHFDNRAKTEHVGL
jgi:hypothetical protein